MLCLGELLERARGVEVPVGLRVLIVRLVWFRDVDERRGEGRDGEAVEEPRLRFRVDGADKSELSFRRVSVIREIWAIDGLE
ncbi:MAG: hypothetical protein ACTSQI_09405 [Candidatus Helarchaeota archaeon]